MRELNDWNGLLPPRLELCYCRDRVCQPNQGIRENMHHRQKEALLLCCPLAWITSVDEPLPWPFGVERAKKEKIKGAPSLLVIDE